MSGTLLSSFNLAHYFNMALALDPTDNTLWMLSAEDFVYYQYDLTGNLISSQSQASIFGYSSYFYSGEFDLGAGGCPVGANADTCVIDSSTNQATAIDAAGGTDTLELGGTTNFSFALGGLGTTFTGFENLDKTGANTVTLTGVGGVSGALNNKAGVLTLGAGAHLSAATITNDAGATINVGVGATLQGTGNTLNNAGVTNIATNGVVTDAGDVNNLATGTINFNGPGGTATLSSGTGVISNLGVINVNSGNVAVTGSITNSGAAQFFIHGTSAVTGVTNFINASTTIYGVQIASGASLSAVTFSNQAGGYVYNFGTITTTGGFSNANQFVNGGGSTLNGTVNNTGGQFVNEGGATVNGNVTTSAHFVSSGLVNGTVGVSAGGSFINNATGTVAGASTNAGSYTNNGAMNAGIANTATFQNSGSIGGAVINNGGTVILLANSNLNGNAIANNGAPSLLSIQGAASNIGAVTQTAGAQTNLLANATFGSFAGAGALILNGNTLTTGGSGASTSFTGTSSGGGGLTKTGTGKFSTASLGHTGLTSVSAGELNTNGTVAGSVTVANNATFSGNFNVAGTLTGLGPNSIISVGNSPGSATVAALAGVTVQNVEVQFNNAGAPVNGTTHDFLNITGNVTGTHTINIIPFAPSGSPTATTGNGIELFRVGGSVASNAFALNGLVIQGGFEYLLNYVPDHTGTNDGFFLKSASIQEVSLNAALLGAGRAANDSCRSKSGAHPGLDGQKGRVWADASDSNLESAAANGVAFDAGTNCHRAGFDAQAGGNLQIGLSGSLSSTKADVFIPQGAATLDGDGVAINAHAAYVKGAMFVQGSVGYAATDWSIQKAKAGVLTATVDGLTAHLDAGHRMTLHGPSTLTLSAALDYDGTACGGGCLVAGATEEVSNWSAGIMARVDTSLANGRVKPFAVLGFSTDLDGGNSVSFGGATTAVDAMSGLFHADLGVEARVWSSLSLYAQGGVIEGLDSETTGHNGRVGAKLTW